MNAKWRNGILITGLATALLGVALYFKRQYKLLRDACYTISGGVVHSLGIDNVKITLFFKVVNESDITIEVSDMDFSIYVNGMYITKIAKKEPQILYSKSDVIIKLDFEFNPKDLLRAGLTNIAPIIYDKEKLVVNTKGTFSLKTGMVKMRNHPFDESITLKELLSPSEKPDKC
jgi:LEA14-like dessication related protein